MWGIKGGIIITKTNLIIDFDGTIVDTIDAYCKAYEFYYHYKPGYISPNPDKVNTWDMKDQCHLVEDIDYLFKDKYFFSVLKTMPNALLSLKELSNKYNLIICTIGSLDNLKYKSQWIRDNLYFIKNNILLNNDGLVMDKSIVNMGNAIFIDDHIDNLNSSNAMLKICYGKEYEWNKNWNGLRFEDWNDLKDYLMNLDVNKI